MRIRPWPIVILAAAHILAPFVNILYSAWLKDISLHYYLTATFSHGNTLSNVFYLIAFPIAGVAIYKTNRWSYPIFLLVMLAAAFSNFLTWREFPQYFGLRALLFTYAVNFGVVTYFLIPQVRSIYFNPRLRWWESKPRYDVELPTKIACGEARSEGTIRNLSEGGAFIDSSMVMLSGNEIELEFPSFGSVLKLPGKVMHVREATPRGYGVQFVHTPESARAMKENIRLIKKSGAQERIGNVSFWQEFKSWFVTAISTGKGFIPDVPRAPKN